ncbi:MAG: RNA polymerase sigma factor [Verrucomicrobiota bacterium]|nr:RNA polymerase sigma factor [Verrucomicrobiota bacterium]
MKAELFQRLVDTWYDSLYRFALSLSRNGDDALDLTQQTFARWAEKGHGLRDQDKAKSWLFTVLYREFIDARRLRQREVSDEAALDRQPPEPCPIAIRIDSNTAMAALRELDPTFRAPLALFYLENHSYKEIAEILDVPIGTVMSRISRAKEQLRIKLQNAAAGPAKVVPMRLWKEDHHG